MFVLVMIAVAAFVHSEKSCELLTYDGVSK